MVIRSLLMALLPFATASLPAFGCDEYTTRASGAEHLQPVSVQASLLADTLNASPYSTGIRFAASIEGSDLLLEITDYPKQAPEVGTIRALMQIGRIVDDGFERMVLVEDEKPLFTVTREELRKVGCRFNWPNNTGDNPLLLMGEMVASLRRADTGEKLFSGSSAPTYEAVTIVLEEINPLWAARRDEKTQKSLEADLQVASLSNPS